MSKSQKTLGPISLLFLSFTAIFGSGWLFAPLYAAQIAGPYSLLSWILGAAMSAVVGITISEIVAMYPETGGAPQVGLFTHGRMVHFLTSVLSFLVFIMLPVVEIRAILQYASVYWPDQIFEQGTLTWIGMVCATFLLALASVANLLGARVISKINGFSVVIKLVAPIVICASLIWKVMGTQSGFTANLYADPSVSWESIFVAVSTSGIVFSFCGFNQATLFAGEAKDPKKSIPFAVLGSLLVTLLLYLLIQFVFLISIPTESLSHGWKALTFPGEHGPFAGLATLLGLQFLLPLIYSDAFVSPIGTAFSYTSAAPRGLIALFPKGGFFGKQDVTGQEGVPTAAILICLVLEILAFLFFPSLKAMLTLLVAAFVFCYSVAPVSLLVLRVTHPDKERPFRLPFPNLFCFFSLFFTQIMVFCCGQSALLHLFIACAVAFAIGLKFFSRKDVRAGVWLMFESAFLVLLNYLHNKYDLPFLLCLGLMALITQCLLHFAQKQSILVLDSNSRLKVNEINLSVV